MQNPVEEPLFKPNVVLSSAQPAPTLVTSEFAAGAEFDDLVTPEIQLEIAVEVIYQLDMAEQRRLLSTNEQSLREFLKSQVASLQQELGIQEIHDRTPVATVAHCALLTPFCVTSKSCAFDLPIKVDPKLDMYARKMEAMVVQSNLPCAGGQLATKVLTMQESLTSPCNAVTQSKPSSATKVASAKASRTLDRLVAMSHGSK